MPKDDNDTRPTPEIGEDELVERLREMLFTASDEAALRDHNTTRQAADRLILYREALEFYANGIGHSEIEDGGAIARAALSGERR